MIESRAARLRRAIEATRIQHDPATPPIDLAPRSTHEAITRQLVEDIGQDVEKLAAKVDRITWTILATILAAVVVKILETLT